MQYCSSGADDEYTLRNNINAFKKIYLKPRVLRDISNISLKTTLLGHKV